MITNINPSSPFISIFKYQEQHGESANIGLTSETESVLTWARTKMIEEQRITELAKSNPTIADAVGALKQAEEQLKIVVALVK